MSKRFISWSNGPSARRRFSSFAIMLSFLLFNADDAAAEPFWCTDTDYVDATCNTAGAVRCFADGPGSIGLCVARGYTVVGDSDFEMCGDPACSTVPGASVPELEDYAIIAFLGLALLIGWRTRKRYCPTEG